MSNSTPPRQYKTRRDGWTPERQLRFLGELTRSRSVAKAAAYAGMSREGAYRMRNRSEGTLFALLWDRAFAYKPGPLEVHNPSPTDGQIMRLLGNHYRRESGISSTLAAAAARAPHVIGRELGDLSRTAAARSPSPGRSARSSRRSFAPPERRPSRAADRPPARRARSSLRAPSTGSSSPQ